MMNLNSSYSLLITITGGRSGTATSGLKIYFGTSARRACLFSRCICISLWEDMVSSLQCGGHKLMALRGDMIAVGVPNFAQ